MTETKKRRHRGGVYPQGKRTCLIWLPPRHRGGKPEYITFEGSIREAKAERERILTARREGKYVAPSKLTIR